MEEKKKKLVVLSGAGMSAESGIATFRDSGGLWENYPVEQVATPEGFRENPQRVLDFYNMRRRELLKAQPNEGHIALAQLEEHFDVRIITQNIDNLHEQAGSTQVLHLHGELMKARSSGDESLVYELSPDHCDIKLGDLCEKGYQLRPHIVWFGEMVPMISEAAQWVGQADYFVIIGTSMNVYPAAGLQGYVHSGVPIYLIDPKEVHTGRSDVVFIRKGASEGVRELRRRLYIHNP
ncbi:MAG TPA: NAD-dependent protein deacylase [Porphyromonadaceae bacterium]|jgi:NAD-dependent deacetylase|uniref:SIR2 family NAD-dependent protein deacylase n=1 Tax=Limibacterium fermenti TaxID=3229863 RepID=UPI000E8CFEB1|nr:NAD-dependent protein deacylase [Porphyromonadaceae bacterium]HBK31841.1 NAD-dependent protein deacylase [Porphyromonadaceae bacterium]HBL33696.1 NAD-dependent protein deacylase [Porphyromonadaceae bacterium]HBX20558.1 NAD-dependent protein deacylase [Porphyromonadaceae bacterium]HBX46892.1 NAD-dependent protein deacylase [Porphyromonadaceae bacterium]